MSSAQCDTADAIVIPKSRSNEPFTLGKTTRYLGDVGRVMKNDMAQAFFSLALFLALGYALYYYWNKKDVVEEEFEPKCGLYDTSNLSTGGNSPQWYRGGGNAGEGGSMDSATTPCQARTYLHGRPRMRSGRKENLEGPYGTVASSDVKCPAGYRLRERQLADGTFTHQCVRQDALLSDFDDTVCSESWSPAATAEALALSSLGNNFTKNYDGEATLHNAVVDATTDDLPSGLSDAQLTDLMYHGAP